MTPSTENAMAIVNTGRWELLSPEGLLEVLAERDLGSSEQAGAVRLALLDQAWLAKGIQLALPRETPAVWADPDVVLVWLSAVERLVCADAALDRMGAAHTSVAAELTAWSDVMQRSIRPRADGWLYGVATETKATKPPWTWLNLAPPQTLPTGDTAQTATLRAWVFGLVAADNAKRIRGWLASDADLRKRYAAMVLPLPTYQGVFYLSCTPASAQGSSTHGETLVAFPAPHLGDGCVVRIERGEQGQLLAVRSDRDEPLAGPSALALAWFDDVLSPTGGLVVVSAKVRETTPSERLIELLNAAEQLAAWPQASERVQRAVALIDALDAEVTTDLIARAVTAAEAEGAQAVVSGEDRNALGLIWQTRVALHVSGEDLNTPEVDGALWELDEHLEALGIELAMSVLPMEAMDSDLIEPDLDTWWARAAYGLASQAPSTQAILTALRAGRAQLDPDQLAAAPSQPSPTRAPPAALERPYKKSRVRHAASTRVSQHRAARPFAQMSAAAGDSRTTMTLTWQQPDGDAFADAEGVGLQLAADDEVVVILGGAPHAESLGLGGVWKQVEMIAGERSARFSGSELLSSPNKGVGWDTLFVRPANSEQVEAWPLST